MKGFTKYKRGYFLPPVECNDWAKKEYIDKAPIWCSVDLRDGNQALETPMTLNEKLEFFQMLVRIGFKQIEVGFPAASETEFKFLRALIENNFIPDDVTVQVLTQSREHIIRRTFESLKGCKNAIVHLYNSTSLAQREQVFKKSKEDIIKIATDGAKLIKKLEKESNENFRYEYSPESFTGTEMEFALEICNEVIKVFNPTKENKLIINLPSTVEMSMPHIYASQIEYMHKNLIKRDCIEISLHPHNDRGTGISDAEMGILAGGDRVEGSLFGNGERTGNVDIIVLALNLYTHGVDPKLDFSSMNEIVKTYQKLTDMDVNPRSPYSGQLVFTAFSGSHQDAIAKGLQYHEEKNLTQWTVPYLPLNPEDIGRSYETDVIRINSQSGKGGVAFVLEENYDYEIPKEMRETVGYIVKSASDHQQKELSKEEVFEIFKKDFVNLEEPYKFVKYYIDKKGKEGNKVFINTHLIFNGKETCIFANGNGPIDGVSNAFRDRLGIKFTIYKFYEHSLEIGSKSNAAAYIGIKSPQNKLFWGVGVDTDIGIASIKALISAINKMIINVDKVFGEK